MVLYPALNETVGSRPALAAFVPCVAASTRAASAVRSTRLANARSSRLSSTNCFVDASLGSVRTQIEQLTAQINSIKGRTEFSTISMSISTLTALPGDTTSKAWDPAKTVGRALAALGAMMQVFADIVIWLIVFGWLPLLAFAILIFATRMRRPTAPTAPTV